MTEEDSTQAVSAATAEGVSSPEDLRPLLEDARAKADEHYDQLLRARADLDNQRKRAERDIEQARRFAIDRFVEALVPVWDALDMGIDAARSETVDVAGLREGMELTLRQLVDAMTRFGVRQIDPGGEPFDPQFHQAMTLADDPGVPPNHVVKVFQKGYLLNERLIRPARVVVARPPVTAVDEQA